MLVTRFRRPCSVAQVDDMRRLEGYKLSAEVARELGVTQRQLQWWAERGVLQPEILECHRRLYSPAQVAQLRKLALLRRARVPLQQIRKRRYLDLDFVTVQAVRKPVLVGNTLFVP